MKNKSKRIFWTDSPTLMSDGRENVRPIIILAYDPTQDKEVTAVDLKNRLILFIKRGYVYTKEGKYGEVPVASEKTIKDDLK